MIRISTLVVTIALLAFMWGCAPQAAPDTREADERAIREIEIEWSKAAVAKDVERYMSFYADDASVFRPGNPTVTGKDATRKGLDAFFAVPGASFSLQTAKVVASRSGDLAYTYGTYAATMNDAKGKPVNDKGKYVVVYRKQPDGKWKVVADIYNSDVPAPAPPKKK
jgi:uncharacterized protein (TIGR02246 family)